MTLFEIFVNLSTRFNDFINNMFAYFNKNKYHKLDVPIHIRKAKSGSLLLIRNSFVLKNFVNYTHALMLYTYNGTQYVITAEPIPYCEVVDIDSYFTTLLTGIAKVDLFEIQEPYAENINEQIESLHNFVMNEIDKKPYETSAIEFLYCKFHKNKTQNAKSFFCSELVVYIAQKFGVPITGLADNYLPDDLAKLPDIWRYKK